MTGSEEPPSSSLVPILHGQFISLLISGTGFFASLLADRSANCPMFLSFLTYLLLSSHLCPCCKRGTPKDEGYSEVEEGDRSKRVSSTSSSSSTSLVRDTGSSATSHLLPGNQQSTVNGFQLECPWYLYFFLALLDVEANVIIISAYNYTSVTSIMLLDCFSIPCVMALSVAFLGATYQKQHLFGVAICLAGMGCIILSDSGKAGSLGPNQNGDDDENAQSDAIKGDILCLVGTSLYALSNVLQEAMVKTKDRTEYLGMLGAFGSLIAIIQTSIFERERLLFDIEWGLVIGLFMVGFVLCLFLMYCNTSAFLKTSDAALFNLSLLTSDVYAVIFAYFVFSYSVGILYYFALILSVTGVLLYNTAGPVHGNVEASVERIKNIFLRGLENYTDYRDRYKYSFTRKDSDRNLSFQSVHNQDNYDCIVDQYTGAITNSTIRVSEKDGEIQ